ncbi:MAG: hypothetical protein HYS27_20010 [Deltaproteobacteria bacterium]|nr:hypothetical protein [Deltaproteobacteria bacterium]
MAKQGWFAYVKRAIGNRWNVLFLLGGTVAAGLSGHADVVFPLLAAAEVAYLATLAWNPRYRAIVDAEQTYQGAEVEKKKAQERLGQLLGQLSRERSTRFFDSKRRCETLRTSFVGADATLTAVARDQLSSVDKLLWVYLKLLHTEQTLERFLGSVSDRELEAEITVTKRHLDMLPPPGTDAMEDKKRATIEDTLQTLQARRDNVVRAQKNYEFVELELQRIEHKLTGIVELAVNRQDPASLTAEVGAVADSVRATEETIGELNMFTGLTQADLEVPEILVEEVAVARR